MMTLDKFCEHRSAKYHIFIRIKNIKCRPQASEQFSFVLARKIDYPCGIMEKTLHVYIVN